MLDEILKKIPNISTRLWIEWTFSAFACLLLSLYFIYLYVGSLYYGIELPGYVFAIPFGLFIGGVAYMLDSLSHNALMKKIPRLEHVVHYFILLSATVPLWLSFILAYWFGIAMLPFSIVFFSLQIYYTLYDEVVFHWDRGIVLEQLVHWAVIWGPGSAQIAFFYWAYIDQYVGLPQLLSFISL